MEKQYSVQFFNSLVENLQALCQEMLYFNQFVELSGYVCVEIDNTKKERYVLNELLQSSGNVVSESFCTKVSRTVPHGVPPQQRKSYSQTNSGMRRSSNECATQRNPPKRPLLTQCVADRRYQTQSRWQSSESVQQQSSLGSSDTFLGLSYIKKQKMADQSVEDFHQFNIKQCQPQLPSLNPGHQKSGPLCRRTENQQNIADPAVSQQLNLTGSPDLSISLISPQSDCSAVPVHLFKNKETDTSLKDLVLNVTQEDDSTKTWPSVVDEVIDLDLIDDNFEFQTDEDSYQKDANQTSSLHLEYDPHQKKTMRPGTQILVKNSVNQFKRFIFDRHQYDIDLLHCPPDKLNALLLEYFKEAKKVDGGELKAKSLKCVQERLILFLKEGGYPYSVIKDKEFLSSREYLKKRLLEDGRVAAQIHSPVDANDIETLFQTCQLGSHTLDTLTSTMWFLNTKYFNIRGPAYHLDLKWGDIVLKINEQGDEYLERPISNIVSLKVFANPADPSRCFVNFYKQFKALRPKVALDESYAFYLKHSRSSVYDGQVVSFLPEPMVYTQFTNIWRKMITASGLSVNKKIM